MNRADKEAPQRIERRVDNEDPTSVLMSTVEDTRPIDQIEIGERCRRDLGDIDALAKTIDELGLLQPIVITPDNLLIAGARRIAAGRKLGWDGNPP